MPAASHTFKAKLWLYPGKGGWHFVTLPASLSQRLKMTLFDRTRAWGSIGVTARIGKSSWKTSLFPSKKDKSCVLPVKADVRRSEKLTAGKMVGVTLEV